jgi:AcrR family transcriptional regulator
MSEEARVDGRRRRGADNRARIIQAMLELVSEGDYMPSAEQVAGRAAVSLRTVFRHFEDMDRLYREIASPFEAEFRLVVQRPFKAVDWRGRILEMVERRTAAYERVAPYRRAANVHRHRSAELMAMGRRMASASREIIRLNLPEHLRDGDLFESLDLLLSIEAWLKLRDEQNLSAERAREVLERSIGWLLEAPGAGA